MPIGESEREREVETIDFSSEVVSALSLSSAPSLRDGILTFFSHLPLRSPKERRRGEGRRLHAEPSHYAKEGTPAVPIKKERSFGEKKEAITSGQCRSVVGRTPEGTKEGRKANRNIVLSWTLQREKKLRETKDVRCHCFLFFSSSIGGPFSSVRFPLTILCHSTMAAAKRALLIFFFYLLRRVTNRNCL